MITKNLKYINRKNINKTMKSKILTIFLISIFLISLASAVCQDGEGNLNSKKQNECVRIAQTCATCSYVNISSISLSTSNETIVSNIEMTSIGNGEWEYQFCNTTVLGSYDVRGEGDLDGIPDSFTSCFDITPSGDSGTSQMIFHLFLILFIYGITFFAFYYAKNIPMTILCGMLMIFLGVYTINNGIIIYRDNITNYISYITIAIGFIISIWALIEQVE